MANTSSNKYQINGKVITVATLENGVVEAIVRQRNAAGVIRRVLARIPANRPSVAASIRRGAAISVLGAYGEKRAPNPGFKTGLQVFNVYGLMSKAA